jgi:hypothetical protein
VRAGAGRERVLTDQGPGNRAFALCGYDTFQPATRGLTSAKARILTRHVSLRHTASTAQSGSSLKPVRPAIERAIVVSGGGAMARPRMRVCAEPGCPEVQLTPRCTAHTREVEQARGSRQARGYGAEHDRLRRSWARRVNTGLVRCARCDTYISPAESWALDHTDDRTGYLGPSHATCNNRAGGIAAHQT